MNQRSDELRLTGAIVAALAVACAGEGAPRVVEDLARGCRYRVPKGWLELGGELRSPASSLFTIRVLGLEGGEGRFVDGLPESIVPQLEEWARSYYVLGGPPARVEASVGEVPALELSYRIRVRPQDPESKLTYWVVRRDSWLYVLRAVYAGPAIAADERAVREILASWAFLEGGPGSAAAGGD
jgi:hypothetical protein